MKYFILILSTALLSAGASPADTGLRVRYLDPSGQISLTVNQDIDVGDMKSIATREFSFALTLDGDPTAENVSVTIDKAKGSYTAHGMKQRLPTRHLPEQSFSVSIADAGRHLAQADSADAPMINLGPYPPTGYSVAGQLVDALPVLPDGSIEVGTTWTTEREIRSLEGWGWGAGLLTSRHRVTAIDRKGDRTIVSVTTEASANLGPIDGGEAFDAELKRTLEWTFDATHGRLLSLAMEQEAEGTCIVPQGQVPFVQQTRVDLTTAS